jgi:hypothetical protein
MTVQWSKENQDKRIIDFKSQSHKHVSKKSKLKVVKKNYIAYENTKMYI